MIWNVLTKVFIYLCKCLVCLLLLLLKLCYMFCSCRLYLLSYCFKFTKISTRLLLYLLQHKPTIFHYFILNPLHLPIQQKNAVIHLFLLILLILLLQCHCNYLLRSILLQWLNFTSNFLKVLHEKPFNIICLWNLLRFLLFWFRIWEHFIFFCFDWAGKAFIFFVFPKTFPRLFFLWEVDTSEVFMLIGLKIVDIWQIS